MSVGQSHEKICHKGVQKVDHKPSYVSKEKENVHSRIQIAYILKACFEKHAKVMPENLCYLGRLTTCAHNKTSFN